jgi:hypothetical protein
MRAPCLAPCLLLLACATRAASQTPNATPTTISSATATATSSATWQGGYPPAPPGSTRSPDDARLKRGTCSRAFRRFGDYANWSLGPPRENEGAIATVLTLFRARCPEIPLVSRAEARARKVDYRDMYDRLSEYAYWISDARFEAKHPCAMGNGPAARSAARSRGCALPDAWRARGVEERDLCIQSQPYALLLEMWEYAGGDPNADDLFVSAVREANELVWRGLSDAERRLSSCRAPPTFSAR